MYVNFFVYDFSRRSFICKTIEIYRKLVDNVLCKFLDKCSVSKRRYINLIFVISPNISKTKNDGAD